jgi:hypothetical protein
MHKNKWSSVCFFHIYPLPPHVPSFCAASPPCHLLALTSAVYLTFNMFLQPLNSIQLSILLLISFHFHHLFFFSTSADTTTPCGFWSSALVHSTRYSLWRDMSSSSLFIPLNHLKPHLLIYFWTSFYIPPTCLLYFYPFVSLLHLSQQLHAITEIHW